MPIIHVKRGYIPWCESKYLAKLKCTCGDRDFVFQCIPLINYNAKVNFTNHLTTNSEVHNTLSKHHVQTSGLMDIQPRNR